MSVRDDDVRALVLATVDASLAGTRADRALAETLRNRPDLTSEERARVAAWALGLALWRGRLDTWIGHPDPPLRLALFLVDREGRTPAESAKLAAIDAPNLLAVLASKPAFTSPIERLAFTRSLPIWLARRWIAHFGEARADALAAAMNERGPIAIRANLLRTTRDDLARRLLAEGVTSTSSHLSPHALRLAGRPNINVLGSWREGLFEVQDEGSQRLADVVDARPGELVVDLCAGSGGKSLALAAAMRDQGRLVAIDLDSSRFHDLRTRAKRAGVTCFETRGGDARDPALTADLAGRADRVLVDAPCSSLGTLRRGPDARWRFDEAALPALAAVQSGLVAAGARLVRPGGLLVYATCSLEPEENTAVVEAFADPSFRLLSTDAVAPDTHGSDGFSWAIWRRAGD